MRKMATSVFAFLGSQECSGIRFHSILYAATCFLVVALGKRPLEI
jgi:hypothetical protein